MAKLVFDIETSALRLEQFDEGATGIPVSECANLRGGAAGAPGGDRAAMQPVAVDRHRCLHRDAHARDFARQVLFTAEDFEEEEGADEAGPVEFVRAWMRSSC